MSNESAATTTENTNETQSTNRGPKLKTEGAYKGEILRHSLGLSANKTPYLELIARFNQIENDALEFEDLETPFSKPVRIYLSTNAMDNSKKTLNHYGFADSTLARLRPGHPDAFSFAGKEIVATCRHGEYKGRPKEEWNVQRRNAPADEAELAAALEEASSTWQEDENDITEFAENTRF